MARLPTPGSDKGSWGDILNDFLSQELNSDGSLKRGPQIDAKANQSAVDAITPQQPGEVIAANSSGTGPILLLGRYTKRLQDFNGNLSAALADLPGWGTSSFQGGEIQLDGEFSWSATTQIPSGVHLVGRGSQSTILRAPAGVNFPLLEINGGSRQVIAGLALLKASGAAATGQGNGLHIHGGASDILIEDVLTDGFVRGFLLGLSSTDDTASGGTGVGDGTNTRITLRRCTSLNSPTTWGFEFDDVDTVWITDCHSRGHWLDGFKLRKRTHNVVIEGGSAIGNGIGYLSDSVRYAGDGLDAYMGGDEFTLSNFLAKGNYGNGITIKQIASTGISTAEFGYVRRCQLINLRCIDNQVGQGLYTAADPGTPPGLPLVAHMTVLGGEFRGNAQNGIRIDARDVTILGPQVGLNQLYGIYVSPNASGVSVAGFNLYGNGQAAAGTYSAIHIDGKHASIPFGQINGTETADWFQESDESALTKYTYAGVRCGTTADDVYVGVGVQVRSTSGPSIKVDAATGTFIIEQRGTGNPNSVGAYGGIGSRYIRTDGTNDIEYRKLSGAPNAPTTGWATSHYGWGPAAITQDPPSIAAGASTTLTMTLSVASGVVAGDMAIVTPPSNLPAGLIITATCGTNQVLVTLFNATAAAIDPPSGSWRVATLKT